MKMKAKIRILREKITGCLRRIRHFFPLREILAGFRTEGVYCPVTDKIRFFSPEYRIEKKPFLRNFFPCCSLKHNQFLRLLGKNNLDISGCSYFINFDSCSLPKKNRISPVWKLNQRQTPFL